MKRIVLFMVAMFATVSYSYAQETQDKIYFDDVVIPQGGSATLVVNLKSADNKYAGLQCDFTLPTGVTATKITSASRLSSVLDPATDDKAFTVQMQNNTTFYRVLIFNQIKAEIPGDDGEVALITLTADADVALGEYEGTLKGITMTTVDKEEFTSVDSKFTVRITDRQILDENSTTAPAAAEKVNVLVKRSIKPDVWNTICLPFEMTAAQLKESFGDYQLANFTGYDASFDTDGTSIASIKVNFETVEAVEANHPYIIKVAEAVSYDTGFRVDDVTIAPTETPVVNCDVTTTVSIPGVGTFPVTTTKQFIGTYVANTIIPAEKLYISNNMFYYSKGSSTLKAFRGYFDFSQVLTDKTVSGGAKLSFSVDGEATTIDGIGQQRIVEGIYDLSGRKIKLEDGDLTKLQKGVYIIDGKKVTIK